MTPTIIVITYNRPDSLKRLLTSINNAQYTSLNIELIISIDFQDSAGHQEVVTYAQNFEWKFGKKTILEYNVNLGLRKHVISCGNLSDSHEAIIMLEDDLIVSPFYYTYASNCLKFYQEHPEIGGISLYNHKTNYCVDLPFDPIEDDENVYFLQIAASWGQAWTKSQWHEFKKWYTADNLSSNNDCLPEKIKNWPESSWVKYYIKYLIQTDRYFVYPRISFTSNLSAPGTHHKVKEHTFSVPFYANFKNNIGFIHLNKSVNVYDSYFEITPWALEQFVPGLKKYNLATIDIFGSKDLAQYQQRNVISSKRLVTGMSKIGYGMDIKPPLMNIKYLSDGDTLHLANAECFVNKKKVGYSENDWDYYYGKKRIRDYMTIFWTKVKKKYIG